MCKEILQFSTTSSPNPIRTALRAEWLPDRMERLEKKVGTPDLWDLCDWKQYIIYNLMLMDIFLTLTRPLRRKLRTWWLFDVSKVKKPSFLKQTSLTPSDFWCSFFGEYQFKPFQLSFFSEFYTKIMFWVRWFYTYSHEWDWREKKRYLFTLTNL